MPTSEVRSLREALLAGLRFPNPTLRSASANVPMTDLANWSILHGEADVLAGRSVLVLTRGQLETAWVLTELDGLAQRVVLFPGSFSLEHIGHIIRGASVDAIVTDFCNFGAEFPHVRYYMPATQEKIPQEYDRSRRAETEWVLLTSGTSGPPKLVAHTLASLAGHLLQPQPLPDSRVWSTFYDIRRYGGLQILLRAMLTGTSMVLSDTDESTGEFLVRAGLCGVTHISGTPSHWRSALMSPTKGELKPRYVRLSGEIADQVILDQLHATYRDAALVHAFASTEAGLAFEVKDGKAGFPVSALNSAPDISMKVEGGTLRIKSPRTALCYLGHGAPLLKGADEFVNTGDQIEQREGRLFFAGRSDGQINVGGQKVYPEEVEAVLNQHPCVQISLVRRKASSLTGAIVIADVVLKPFTATPTSGTEDLKSQILRYCRESLSPYKVPAVINFVPALDVSGTGKLQRASA
jgi:acyl-coenzyme A synthetase/AMP-(fatty) acid ligase